MQARFRHKKCMEVFLTRAVSGLGRPGDTVHVAPGYARNTLFPGRLAVPVAASELLEEARLRAQEMRAEERSLVTARLAGRPLEIERATAPKDDTRLLLPVKAADIAELLEERGVRVSPSTIEPTVLRKPGRYTICVEPDSLGEAFEVELLVGVRDGHGA